MGPQNVNGRLLPLHLWQCSSEDDTEIEEDGDGACGNNMDYVPEEELGEESGGEDEVQFENEIWVNTVSWIIAHSGLKLWCENHGM